MKSVITSHLHTSFRKIGAFVQAVPVPTGSRRAPGEVRRRITVRDRVFELTLSANTLAVVTDCRPDERHLVLSLQNPDGKPERFLCGYSAREKELRRLEREARRLRQAKADAPIVPLERAFQRGWVKTYVLVDGIVRRPDAQIFRTILAAVNRSVWARDRSFVHHRTRRPIVFNPRVIPFREWEN